MMTYRLFVSLYSDNCAMALPDGQLAFGTHDGVTLVTPPEGSYR